MMITKVLIAIDDSKTAEHAAAYGFDIARKFNAAVGLVNVIEPILASPLIMGSDPMLGSPAVDSGMEEMELLDIQKGRSESIVESTIKKFASDLQITHFSEYGSSAQGIIHCAEEFGADLIVLGTHSRTGFDRLLMGSVAEHVVRHAEVPVLVVPMSS
jgi:nucleotide-binding universal stress UspA family protein